MAPFRVGTAALLVAGIALTATPSSAQRREGRQDGERDRREATQTAQPRQRGEVRRQAQPQVRVEPRRPVEPQGRVEPYRGSINRPQRPIERRDRVESGRVSPYRGYNNRPYGYRPYDYRPYRSYGYAPHVRTYVIPYGYRPYGYRPGWSLNLYFGRPYGGYGYPAYGYPAAGYGYYAIDPRLAYGAVRIVDAPRGAQVFVDGYYAGVVDDYDGVFQRLNLEAGPHHIEIEDQGYPPIAFDVRIEPGQTITYHANMP